jgi:hypothetical protein
MRGNHLDIIFIEGNELEFVRARIHSIASLLDFRSLAKISDRLCHPQERRRKESSNLPRAVAAHRRECPAGWILPAAAPAGADVGSGFAAALAGCYLAYRFGSSIEEFKSLLIDSFQYQQCEESFASWLYAR